jgi:hypothetical protein
MIGHTAHSYLCSWGAGVVFVVKKTKFYAIWGVGLWGWLSTGLPVSPTHLWVRECPGVRRTPISPSYSPAVLDAAPFKDEMTYNYSCYVDELTNMRTLLLFISVSLHHRLMGASNVFEQYNTYHTIRASNFFLIIRTWRSSCCGHASHQQQCDRFHLNLKSSNHTLCFDRGPLIMELLPRSDYSTHNSCCDRSRFLSRLIPIKALDGGMFAQTPYTPSRYRYDGSLKWSHLVAIYQWCSICQLFYRFVESKWDEDGDVSFLLTCFAVVSCAAVVYDWGEQNNTFQGYH